MKRPQGADTLLTSLLLSPARSGVLLYGMILGRSARHRAALFCVLDFKFPRKR
jgi:hypothetical protein